MGKIIGIAFVGCDAAGNEQVLEVNIVAPCDRNLEAGAAMTKVAEIGTKYWNQNEEFWAGQGFHDFAMRHVEVTGG